MAQEMIIPIRFSGRKIVPYNREVWEATLARFEDKNALITVKEYHNHRSLKQNAFYWGFIIPLIKEFLDEYIGEPITKDDIHSYNLKQVLGDDFMVKEVLSVPIISRSEGKTPSKMNSKEFGIFIASVQKMWAEYGLYIPDRDSYYGNLI